MRSATLCLITITQHYIYDSLHIPHLQLRVYRASQVVQLTCMPYTTQTSEFGMRNIEGSHGYGCPPHSLALSVPVVVFGGH